ncbi:MAG: electron transfer flavoprotein subunit alpha/FixB family protein [Desulfatitalea sp.]|nr:electron transfer flavoprotein subunit alpha/FixB family protein [Desulfatitalea sp.]NNJ99926.1 electron transfer flavoprotein subunit alpha/FixB family protein [Desulfatitalea sp.]
MANILLIAEDKKRELKKVTLNALTFAKQAAEKINGQVIVLAVGAGISKVAEEISAYGVSKVITAETDGLENYIAETWSAVVADVTRANDVGLVCMASTSMGKDLMPRVAATLGAGMASDVLGFDGATFTRTMWAGNAYANVEITTPIKVCTVQGTAFDTAEKAGDSPVESFMPTIPEAKTRFIGFNESVSERPDLTEASVIVSGGRGLKGSENFKLIEDLADLFGGAVGATRAAVDAGWMPNDLQVGQTGKIVASDIYFAIGLSGAIQHMAGMKNSKYIIAINKDEEAPIFEIADAGLVADLFKVLPEITNTIRKEMGK